jgi:8-oxo-dGTP pyrophosphatase MutT (NUDIX family)
VFIGAQMRQIAALPYRLESDTDSAGIRVLLVTSRGTGRWVIPKGNIDAGLSPHAAAALEAQEEAGVRGALCPIALGSYRYRKRRRFWARQCITAFPTLPAVAWVSPPRSTKPCCQRSDDRINDGRVSG